jgi:hypothetical protein
MLALWPEVECIQQQLQAASTVLEGVKARQDFLTVAT